MAVYDEIKTYQVKDTDRTRLNLWVEEEVLGLLNDFGQKMDAEVLEHTCQRLRDALTTRYRSWAVGDVHAVLQTGMSGGYGTVHKVTVKSLFSWLKSAQQQRAVRFAIKSESMPRTAPELKSAHENDFGSFVLWLSKEPRVYIKNLFPEYDDTKKEIPAGLRDLQKEYQEAKAMDMLPALKRRLLGVGV